MNEDALFELITPWVKRFSGLNRIIRDHLGKPRPAGSYGMLNLISMRQVRTFPSDEEYFMLDPTPINAPPMGLSPVIEWEWVFSFNVYAKGASDFARKVVSAGKSQAGLETLGPLTLNRVGMLQRLPEMIAGVWEDRISIDLFFRGLVRDVVSADVVEHVTVTGTNIHNSEDAVSTVTVNKP